MTVIAGQSDISIAFCKALGIEIKGVFKVIMYIEVDEAVSVEVYRRVQDTELKALTEEVKKYELKEIEE